jgi:zinc D-Ala-D-Ala dipeptidase
LIKSGLINVQTIDNSIRVKLVNSNKDYNYFRENFYIGLNKAYLQKEVAVKLAGAQRILKSKDANYSLLIMDAARPGSVSRLMYQKMKDTKYERYIANPEKGSMHNYGIAVDITIMDGSGELLEMGFTPFYKSDFQLYWQFIKMKFGSRLTIRQKRNRKLLSSVMQQAGFRPSSFEWWHFDGLTKSEARKNYEMIE